MRIIVIIAITLTFGIFGYSLALTSHEAGGIENVPAAMAKSASEMATSVADTQLASKEQMLAAQAAFIENDQLRKELAKTQAALAEAQAALAAELGLTAALEDSLRNAQLSLEATRLILANERE